MLPNPQEVFDELCKERFDTIDLKLTKIDTFLRGNGQLGVAVRLDRLEQSEGKRSRLAWTIVGACVAAGASLVVTVIKLL